jgi:hypothetical protein
LIPPCRRRPWESGDERDAVSDRAGDEDLRIGMPVQVIVHSGRDRPCVFTQDLSAVSIHVRSRRNVFRVGTIPGPDPHPPPFRVHQRVARGELLPFHDTFGCGF